jgi:aminoglycoside 6'-N-acetyltransferase I
MRFVPGTWHPVLVIGTLTKQQLPACASLYVETFNAPPWNESWRVEDATQRLEDILATPRAHGVHLGTSADDLIGFAVGHLERSGHEDHFLLQEVCVRPGQQRQGRGTALLEALRVRLPEVRNWYLLTARDSDASKFYEKNGFRLARRMAVFVQP